MGPFGSGKTKSRQMKGVMQVIESIARVEGIYKDREGWYLAYTKLLWEKFVDKHFFVGL